MSESQQETPEIPNEASTGAVDLTKNRTETCPRRISKKTRKCSRRKIERIATRPCDL